MQMFRGQYNNAQLSVDRVDWGTKARWVEVLQANILDLFRLLTTTTSESLQTLRHNGTGLLVNAYQSWHMPQYDLDQGRA